MERDDSLQDGGCLSEIGNAGQNRRDAEGTMITIEQCKPGWLYQIIGRNADVGIYDPEQKGFKISRHKFGSIFIDNEFHWHADPRFGTAKPIREIEEAPKFANNQDMVAYLEQKYEELKARGPIPGWTHRDTEKCHRHPDRDGYFSVKGKPACEECLNEQ